MGQLWKIRWKKRINIPDSISINMYHRPSLFKAPILGQIIHDPLPLKIDPLQTSPVSATHRRVSASPVFAGALLLGPWPRKAVKCCEENGEWMRMANHLTDTF